jgi:RNA polymerase sigma-70 factor (ECF subfamily)
VEDAKVMAQVREGHVEHLALLFERHHLHLFNFFLRLTGRRGASEDLVQEVFLRLLRYRSSFRPGSPFAPWMWQIARNAHRDHLKALQAHTPLDDLQAGLPDDQEGPDVLVMRDQDSAHLQLALDRLEPSKRELLLLSRNPDLPYKHLAPLMACSVGALKVQVHRALKELKTVFMELHGGAS